VNIYSLHLVCKNANIEQSHPLRMSGSDAVIYEEKSMATPEEAMEYIWEKVSKQNNSKNICYTKADVYYLYCEGFVDTRQYSLKQWEKALKPFKKSDETYVFNKQQFLSIRKYRYNGPSHEVFDAQKVRDGAWTDDELDILYERSIRQASEMPKKAYKALLADLKKNGFSNEKNELVIDANIKIGLGNIIKAFPSPRTRLEYKVKQLRETGEDTWRKTEKKRGKSKFSVGSTAVETTLASLKKLQGSSPKKEKKAKKATKKSKEKDVDIKTLRKPGGKVFG